MSDESGEAEAVSVVVLELKPALSELGYEVFPTIPLSEKFRCRFCSSEDMKGLKS